MADLGVQVASGVSTPGANTRTANLVTGTYAQPGPGVFTLVAKQSAAGIKATLLVGGIPLALNQTVSGIGLTGTMSITDNIEVAQFAKGGIAELYLENITSTAGTTCDYKLFWRPGGK